MSITLCHESLRTTLSGTEVSGIAQFRGIPYGYIPRRFEEAKKLDQLPGHLDCTKFGPRCPQIQADVGHLLRIPPHHKLPVEPEDEFECTNLDVTLPKLDSLSSLDKLPVLVWIHGGSQAVSFGTAASGICESYAFLSLTDMTTIVADSVRQRKPIISVTVQYRLNIFALGKGNGEGPVNLALRDQALALQWIQEHISGFKGDPTRVTLAGESAGAVYCHAHLTRNAPVQQYILSSGTLYLSPPQSPKSVQTLRDAVLKQVKAINPLLDLDTASVDEITKAVRHSGLQSFCLEWEEQFEDWQNSSLESKRIMLGDVNKEAVIWQTGVRLLSPNEILAAFDAAGEHSDELKKAYHIYMDRPSSCYNGAIDFINDYKFLLPIQRLEKFFRRDAQIPIFRYLIDEANPWQPSSGAHHAVDLILLFGGFDLSFSRGSELTGQAMRDIWTKFINVEQPWTSSESGRCYGFGPHGVSKVLNDWEVKARRRIAEANILEKMDSMLLDRAFVALAAGRVSLSN
ncbi:related to carboxylesterase [Fusarium mangiferae]|uniref:Related to carboxylesterase n=1 Tax=Fusarium mangiferae TaxID=192010 RepID=A0A1L7TDE1_FUSMA|nr:uncharacterized protein FMAN_10955 [Fusarium mangiferae]CVK96624.1 related to carboxylesterase [Fusarium mangiferae]